jgi:hypothetical protein
MAGFYVTLRDCFVGDRYYHQGQVYDLPESLEKSPKNFRAIDEAAAPVIPAEPAMPALALAGPQKDEPMVMVEKTLAIQLPVGVLSETTTNALDWDNAEVYVSDKDKAKNKNKKK